MFLEKFKLVCHVISCKINDVFSTEIHWVGITRNSSNYLSFINDYFILVHIKTIFNKIYMKTIFDEIEYIVEYSIANIFSFLVVFDWGKTQDDNNI